MCSLADLINQRKDEHDERMSHLPTGERKEFPIVCRGDKHFNCSRCGGQKISQYGKICGPKSHISGRASKGSSHRFTIAPDMGVCIGFKEKSK